MTIGRRPLLSFASCALLYSGMASALGMGEITLHSALNQPLSAEIALLDVGNLSAEDIRVTLASSADFTTVGVERLAFLQDLTFTPVIDGSRSRVRVTSTNPVREPYLNFLVELSRSQSRMLREFTVLLDPMPEIGQVEDVAVAVPQPVTSPVRSEPARFVPPAELPQASAGKRHQVTSGDSLWTIANLYAAGASQAQFMRDIQALNPDAFAGGDSSRLMMGASLLLPDTAVTPKTDVALPEETVAETAIEHHSTTNTAPADRAPLDDQVELLRRQLFEELAASREENQQLKQMLADMRLQLENVTAQMVQQAEVTNMVPVKQTAANPVTPAESVLAAQVAVAEPVAAFRWHDWMLPAAGVLLSLLLGGWWLARRRTAADIAPDAEPLTVMPPARPVAVATPAVEMPRQPAHASVSETDVLEAADLYITYGRRDEALDVLQRGIERSPEQLDLRLRHLGLLAESGNVKGYSAAADEYLNAGGGRAQLEQLLALHPALASAVMPLDQPADLGDPDVTFILNESFTSSQPPVAAAPAQLSGGGIPDSVDASFSDSETWLDDLDLDEVLSIDELPALLDDEGVGSMPSAEDLRELEPNPEHLVRLNQAIAYIEQGDIESACTILDSLATAGDEQQRQQVSELLARIA